MPTLRVAIQLPDEASGRQRIVEDARAVVTGDGADAVGHHRGDRRVAIGPHPDDLHDQRIGRRQAFDVEGTDLAGPRAARPFVVVARRREGIRLDDVARLDAEDRFAHREGRCPGRRYEAMHFCVGNRRRARDGGKGQAGDEAHAAHRIAASPAAPTVRGERTALSKGPDGLAVRLPSSASTNLSPSREPLTSSFMSRSLLVGRFRSRSWTVPTIAARSCRRQSAHQTSTSGRCRRPWGWARAYCCAVARQSTRSGEAARPTRRPTSQESRRDGSNPRRIQHAPHCVSETPSAHTPGERLMALPIEPSRIMPISHASTATATTTWSSLPSDPAIHHATKVSNAAHLAGDVLGIHRLNNWRRRRAPAAPRPACSPIAPPGIHGRATAEGCWFGRRGRSTGTTCPSKLSHHQHPENGHHQLEALHPLVS